MPSEDVAVLDEQLGFGVDIDFLRIVKEVHRKTQHELMMACEESLGVTFINWQTFVRFCHVGPEGKEYFQTLDKAERESVINAGVFIEEIYG